MLTFSFESIEAPYDKLKIAHHVSCEATDNAPPTGFASLCCK